MSYLSLKQYLCYIAELDKLKIVSTNSMVMNVLLFVANKVIRMINTFVNLESRL